MPSQNGKKHLLGERLKTLNRKIHPDLQHFFVYYFLVRYLSVFTLPTWLGNYLLLVPIVP